jgi:transposase
VANPRQLPLISHSAKKTDRTDAITLARLALSDATLLSPIQTRPAQQQIHLSWVRARAKLVAVRTDLLNSARGLVKPHGLRLARRDAATPQAPLAQDLPPDLQPAIGPMLKIVDQLSEQIKVYDRQLAELAATHYPEIEKLRKIRGVGLIVALT